MDASEKRKLIKSAREALASKKYQEALVSCKAVLKEDRSCYEAFVGKAAFHLGEHPQAEAAYTRATGLDAKNALGWQGLAEVHSETGAWDKAAQDYSTLAQLCSAPDADPAARTKFPAFLRRAAEAFAKAGQLEASRQAWQQLLEMTPEGPEWLGILCALADVLLAGDEQALAARAAEYMESARAQGVEMSEGAAREAVEGDWAEASLEAGGDGGVVGVLRAVVERTPPSPQYTPYHDAWLHRLRCAVHASSCPSGSMERHARRSAVLQAAMAAVHGQTTNDAPGGCCSAMPYESALTMLEVECAVSAGRGGGHAAAAGADVGGAAVADGDGSCQASQLRDMEHVAVRFAHSFPWDPTASVHLALAQRRRAAGEGEQAGVPATSTDDPATTTRLDMAAVAVAAPQKCRRLPPRVRRRRTAKVLLHGLRACGPAAASVAGWLAASELLLAEGAADAALDAAKQGVAALSAHDLLHHEAMVQPDLLLKLAAGRALAARAGVPPPGPAGYTTLPQAPPSPSPSPDAAEASAWLGGLLLGGRVGGGAAGFARLAGSEVPDLHHQSTRCLAQLALRGGDVARARALYEGLVGAAAMGRAGTGAVEAWAVAEYGVLLLAAADYGAALEQLESALAATGPPTSPAAGTHVASAPASHPLARARYHLLAAQAAWGLGGAHREERGAGAHAHALSAAKEAEVAQGMLSGSGEAGEGEATATAAAAYTLLGTWYQEEGGDAERAAKCFRRALDLDVHQGAAGAALVGLMCGGGKVQEAQELCENTMARSPQAPPHWALRALGLLQLAGGDSAGAGVSLQRAIRSEPGAQDLWEALGASYQGTGKASAALKAYTRALELGPGRVLSLAQAGALHYGQGAYREAGGAYSQALELQPTYMPALMGAAETWLASACMYARMGATGTAAVELGAAADFARRATKAHPNSTAGWKVLGDVELQHALVTPAGAQQAQASAPAGEGAVAAAVQGLAARVERVQAATRAYAHALHMDPTQGLVWGDAGTALSRHASLLKEMGATSDGVTAAADAAAPTSTSTTATLVAAPHTSPASLLNAAARRAVRRGLRLDPTSDWLWSCAGGFAASVNGHHAGSSDSAGQLAAEAEFCYVRALQLNPKRAATWAALGRLYARMGAAPLAQRCYEQGRTHEPTLAAVWEGMGHLAAAGSTSVRDASFRDALDAHEHALGLGGGPESWLACATGSLMAGRGCEGETLAAATKAAAHMPLLPGPRVVVGLAAEARGLHAEAVGAFTTARELLHRPTPEPSALLPPALLCSSPVSALVEGADAGSSDASTLSATVSLNVARSAARSGDHKRALKEFEALGGASAVAAVKAGGGAVGAGSQGWPLGADAAALAAYAHALKQAGRVHEAISALEAAVSVATSSATSAHVGATAAATVGVARLRMACVRSLAQAYMSVSVPPRPRDAYSLVVAHTADVGAECDSGCMDVCVECWMAVLAGAALGSGQGVDEAEVRSSMLAWAASCGPKVDLAQVTARAEVMSVAVLMARGQHTEARRRAAVAVHTCPWASPAWVCLGTAAEACGGAHMPAATRATPRIQMTPQPTHSVHRMAPALSASFTGAVVPPGTTDHHPPFQHSAATTTASAAYTAAAVSSAATVRASGLLASVAAPWQVHGLRAEISWLERRVHVDPACHTAWHLLALLSLQLAVASGQCRLYRAALVRSKVATVHAKREFAECEAAAADTTAATTSSASAPPPGFLPPGLAMAMGGAPPPSPAAMAKAAEARAARTRVAEMVLRLLAATSECVLHSRLPRANEAAKEAATDALRWALQQGLDASLAHRQLARCHAAACDAPNIAQSVEQAGRGGDLLAALEGACLVAGAKAQEQHGEQAADGGAESARAVAAILQAKGGVCAPWEQGLVGSAQLVCAVRLLADGDPEGARDALMGAIDQGQLPAAAVPAAHVLQSVSAAALAGRAAASGDEGARKLQLEARWAAATALKELKSYPEGGACVVMPEVRDSRGHVGGGVVRLPASTTTAGAAVLALAEAEALRGRHDKALEAALQVLKTWPKPVPVDALSFAASLDTCQAAMKRTLAAEGVHVSPWDKQLWSNLLTTSSTD